MDEATTADIPIYGWALIALIGVIIVWIAAGLLWNRKWVPQQRKKGIPVPSFNNALGRIIRFLFKEDVHPSEKIKNPKLRKFATWRNGYLVLLAASVIMPLLGLMPFIPLALFGIVAFVRVRQVFRPRNALLQRMYEVANSQFRYPRGTELNPWSVIRVQEWVNLTSPGKTVVSFPPTFRSDDPRKRSEFQQHFDGTVAEDNIWKYEWSGTKGIVECAPVPHLPTMVKYPGSTHRAWDEIPLGVGIDGEIVWKPSVFPHALICGTTGGGKSALQRNIIFHCIQHSDRWKFLGVDLKRVELDPYAKYEDTVLGIAKDLADGVEVMRYARDAMMERYEEMEKMGVNHFMQLPSPPPALMVMVDEAYMFMAPNGGKTDQQKEEDQLHGEATVIIGEIARLGRAAGVHLVLATQRPDAKVIYGEIKENLMVRYMAGRAKTTASLMVLDSDSGTRVPSDIKGRGVISLNGEEEFIQGYFAEQDWIDNWLRTQQNGAKASNILDDDAEESQADKSYDAEEENEEGVYPKKKREKKSKKRRSIFPRLKPVPDFDDGQLTYGEASPVPEDFGKEADPKVDLSGDSPNENAWSADEEDDHHLIAPAAPSLSVDDDDDDNELVGGEFAPTVTPVLSALPDEDDEDDDDRIMGVPSRPNLSGGALRKENSIDWDDDLDDLFEQLPPTPAPSAPKASKTPLSPKPNLSTAKESAPVATAPVKTESVPSARPTLPSRPVAPAAAVKLSSGKGEAESTEEKKPVSVLTSLPPLPPRPKM